MRGRKTRNRFFFMEVRPWTPSLNVVANQMYLCFECAFQAQDFRYILRRFHGS